MGWHFLSSQSLLMFCISVPASDNEYVTMVHHLEAGTEIQNISKDCELRKCHSYSRVSPLVWCFLSHDISCQAIYKHHIVLPAIFAEISMSRKQDATEVSHKSMFNLSPNHTLHADFCEYGGQDYMVLVDRLTGYIMAEKTPNKGTDSAIAVVKNWSLLFGSPMRIISDDGPQ